jgi:hypothetical protein
MSPNNASIANPAAITDSDEGSVTSVAVPRTTRPLKFSR